MKRLEVQVPDGLVEVIGDGPLMDAAESVAEKLNGPLTHTVFWIDHSIIGNGETPTTLIVADEQPVFPASLMEGEEGEITQEMIEQQFPAGGLSLKEKAIVPLICATNNPEHYYVGVRMEKIGRTRKEAVS